MKKYALSLIVRYFAKVGHWKYSWGSHGSSLQQHLALNTVVYLPTVFIYKYLPSSPDFDNCQRMSCLIFPSTAMHRALAECHSHCIPIPSEFFLRVFKKFTTYMLIYFLTYGQFVLVFINSYLWLWSGVDRKFWGTHFASAERFIFPPPVSSLKRWLPLHIQWGKD